MSNTCDRYSELGLIAAVRRTIREQGVQATAKVTD
jgi:hypothetical protein